MIVRIAKIDKNVNWGARDPKTNKLKHMFDGCIDKLVPGLDAVTGTLRTGLVEKEEKRFENAMGYDEGSMKKSGSFWSNFSIKIPEEGLTLNTENIAQELQYKVLLADPHVAKSLSELKTHPTAEYVMTSEGAEAKVSNNKRNTIAQAYSTFAKLSKSETIDALYMFGQYADDVDFEVAQNRLGDIVDKDPKKFMLVVGDENFKDKVWFMKLIKEGIVAKHGTGSGPNQPLYFNDISLGNGLDEAIAFIKAKENNLVALGLKKALKA
tara:strand:+ start:332 stop:1132 length:801 start_codon:yes stop_codon:yes gene_type:complete